VNRAFCYLLVLLPSAWCLGRGSWDSIWFGKWAVLLALLLIAVTVFVSLRIHWSVAPTMLSTVLGALAIVGWSRSHYANLPLEDFEIIRRSAAYLLISVLTFALFFSFTGKKMIRDLLDAFGWLCLLNSVCMIMQWVGGYPIDGFFGNPSMSACLTAVTAPLIRRVRPNRKWLALPILAVVLSKTSMGIGTMAVVLAALYARGWKSWVALSIGTVFSAAFVGKDFLSTNGRMDEWKIAMSWWWKDANHWIGTGAGSTFFLLPDLQRTHQPWSNSFFMFLHNDWLQTLFEQGYLGLSALLLLFFCAINRAARNRSLLASLLGYGASGVGNFPLHLPTHAFLGATLVAASFSWERE
jgi:hypothetical protein